MGGEHIYPLWLGIGNRDPGTRCWRAGKCPNGRGIAGMHGVNGVVTSISAIFIGVAPQARRGQAGAMMGNGTGG